MMEGEGERWRPGLLCCTWGGRRSDPAQRHSWGGGGCLYLLPCPTPLPNHEGEFSFLLLTPLLLRATAPAGHQRGDKGGGGHAGVILVSLRQQQ